jgi:hypothetical protein
MQGAGSATSSNVCSPASPCAAGDSGCPNELLPYPNGDACPEPGHSCYGYGSFSCPQTLTCVANRTWVLSCPEHPFGLDSGTCGCAPVTTVMDGGSSG